MTSTDKDDLANKILAIINAIDLSDDMDREDECDEYWAAIEAIKRLAVAA